MVLLLKCYIHGLWIMSRIYRILRDNATQRVRNSALKILFTRLSDPFCHDMTL